MNPSSSDGHPRYPASVHLAGAEQGVYSRTAPEARRSSAVPRNLGPLYPYPRPEPRRDPLGRHALRYQVRAAAAPQRRPALPGNLNVCAFLP